MTDPKHRTTKKASSLTPIPLSDAPSGIEVKRENSPGYRPKLPDWGVFLNWPQKGLDWIHPDDVSVVKAMIPGQRVFKRSAWDESYYTFVYGEAAIRLKPTLWLRLEQRLDLEVGQQVELLARLGRNDPGVFRVAEILWDAERGCVTFCLKRDGLVLPRPFTRQDLRPVHVRHHLRTGFYQHEPPKHVPVQGEDRIDVRDLGE